MRTAIFGREERRVDIIRCHSLGAHGPAEDLALDAPIVHVASPLRPLAAVMATVQRRSLTRGNAFGHAADLMGDDRTGRHSLGGRFRRRTAPAREPADQRTERQTDLGREGNVGGNADDDAEAQPNHGSDYDRGPNGRAAQVLHRLLAQPGGFEGIALLVELLIASNLVVAERVDGVDPLTDGPATEASASLLAG